MKRRESSKHYFRQRIIEAWLAIELIIRDDPHPVLTNEFKRVQAAKVIHRMASGSHKQWEKEVPDLAWSGLRTKSVVQEMHIYPRSRGRVLRHIGEDLEWVTELLVHHNLDEIHAEVVKR
ncbi:MAG: hypothetical protein HQL35_06820 [Alphaproteobacteria bacterium]|nr:hypothetical protein [Alphaproteobacteria bacterium]